MINSTKKDSLLLPVYYGWVPTIAPDYSLNGNTWFIPAPVFPLHCTTKISVSMDLYFQILFPSSMIAAINAGILGMPEIMSKWQRFSCLLRLWMIL